MIRRFKKLFGFKDKPKNVGLSMGHEPLIVPRKEHELSREHISDNALKVLYRLKKNGFAAYLVGGGVRDLLLGLKPKDFDVATDATPEDIKRVFNNCRLIGRRFRLAHVYFGRDIVEVATFRGNDGSKTSEQGMLLRDNVYGTLEEDAWRRDFTVNALYYNIDGFSIVDYTGGMADLNDRTLRMIGDPEIRFREDPVRMLRAIRLSQKLGLELEAHLPVAILGHAELISHVPSARLFEEAVKLFHCGAGVKAFEQLKSLDLLYRLFPFLEKEHSAQQADFIRMVLQNTDERIAQDKSVNPAFVFSALLWHPLLTHVKHLKKEHGMGTFQGFVAGSDHVLNQLRKNVSIPKRLAMIIKEIWMLQLRFERRQPKRIHKVLHEPRFRAAFDFLLLRARVNDVDQAVASWWETIEQSDEQERLKMIKALDPNRPRRKKKKKKTSHQE